MKKNLFISSLLLATLLISNCVSAATVINKDDAALFSKKSIYSEVGVKEEILDKSDDDTGLRQSDDAINKFNAVIATKTGDTYTNKWSNYTIDIVDGYAKATDMYDFNADGIKYDFGIYFSDWSRLAVYYTRLAKDISVVCANFAPGKVPDEVIIADVPYKHVRQEVEYPYGVELYDYYLRAIDGKLMVIETFTEEGKDISQGYIERFEKVK